MYVDGSILYSQEGTTQGDPLAMPMYAIALLPLIEGVNPEQSVTQMWYADDATACREDQKAKRLVECPRLTWSKVWLPCEYIKDTSM